MTRLRIYEVEDNGAERLVQETDWASFCTDNADGFDDDERAKMFAELKSNGRVWIGGGAVPLSLITCGRITA